MSKETEKLAALPDNEIDTSDIPEVTDWTNAKRGKFYRIKTAFFADPMGGGGRTPEEEMASEKESLEEELGVKLDVKMVMHMGQIEEGTDLLLFDFGGMMMGNSLAEDNSRRVLRWAEDHPSALVIIISAFTYNNAFRYAIEEHLGLEAVPYDYSAPEGKRHETPIHNIVVEQSREDYIPSWFREAHGCKPYENPWGDFKRTPEAEIEKEVNADIQKLTETSDEPAIRELEKRVHKKKPVTDPRDAAMVLELQKLDPGRNARVAATLAAMKTRGAVVLPAQTFFEPNKAFLAYMKKHFRLRYIYDVGAGAGHVTAALRKAGIKKVNPIDLFPRADSVVKITYANSLDYPFKSESLVMFCRPCHGHFVCGTITRALRRKVGTIMYVGLSKNVKHDLGDYYRKFKRVLTNVGEDQESLWIYQGK